MPDYLVEDFAVAPSGAIERLDSGAIRVRARVARTGVQEYPSVPGAPVTDRAIRLYRPADEVFSDAALASMRSNPITVGHPSDGEVRAENWRQRAVGHIEGHDIKRVAVDSAADGHGEEFVEASIVIFDPATIARIDAKELREFSSGYVMQLDWTPGVYKGTAYDGVQRAIRHNHQAILRAGDARAGREARILDSNTNPPKDAMTLEEALKALADAKAENEKLKSDVSKANDSLTAEKAAHAETEKKLGAALAAPKGLDSAAVETAISERLALQDSARGMLPGDYVFAGKPSRTIKLDAIKACRADLAKELGENPSDGLLDGAFLALTNAKTVYVKPTVDSQNTNKSPRQVYLDAVAELNRKSRG